MLIEFDLAGAEWVITAHYAGDKNMLDVVESGKSPHVVTGSLIAKCPEDFVLEENELVGMNTDPDFIRELRRPLKDGWGSIMHTFFLPRSMSIRQMGKKSNHSLNYYLRHRNFALKHEIPETDAKIIVDNYSTVAYPGLQGYWEDTRNRLRKDRTLTNPFGRKVRFLGEWGVELWMAAYSFRPQSTCFDTCRAGMMNAWRDEQPAFQPAQLCAQVHDSVVYDYMSHNVDLIRQFCATMKYHHMRVPMEITDVHGVTRELVLNVDCKMGMDWGDMKSVPHPEVLESLEPYLNQTAAVA